MVNANDAKSLGTRSRFVEIAKAAMRMYFPQMSVAVFVVNRVKVHGFMYCFYYWLKIAFLIFGLNWNFSSSPAQAFANPEDLKMVRAVEVRFNDAHVERSRRLVFARSQNPH